MKRYNETDAAFYAEGIDGDLIIESGDIKLTGDYESARQDIENRVRTQTTDWRHHPEIGGDLELLEGEPNTRDTATQGMLQMLRTLTYDGRFRQQDLTIRPVPSSVYQIDYYTFLDAGEDKPLVVKQNLNL